MPQELQVVRCFSCETFQVDIVKKVPKWTCKICGEKQSLKKVYSVGSGKECRELVQSLNKDRLNQPEMTPKEESKWEEESIEVPKNSNIKTKSKWSEFTTSPCQKLPEDGNQVKVENIFEEKYSDIDSILTL